MSNIDIKKFELALESMESRILNCNVTTLPSPHIFIDGFLDDYVRRTLISFIPKQEEFDDVDGGSFVISSILQSNVFWKTYDCFSKNLLLKILPKFAPWFEEKEADLKPYGLSCRRLSHYPSFISFTKPSRGIPPHIDGNSSVLNALTLFGYINGEVAPVTNFYLPTTNGFDKTTFYKDSNSSLFVWLNLPTAWHGVTESLKPFRLTYLAALESYEKIKS